MSVTSEYNAFLAIQTLNLHNLSDELARLSTTPEFNRILDGLLSLVSEKNRFGTAVKGFDPYLVSEKTVSNLRYLFRVDRSALSPTSIEMLDKVEDTFYNSYISGLGLPVLPPETSLYFGQPPVEFTEAHLRIDSSIYEFFAKKPKPREGRDFITAYGWAHQEVFEDSQVVAYPKVVGVVDLEALLSNINHQTIKCQNWWFSAVMRSEVAFTGKVSKNIFCIQVDAARRRVDCAGFYAAVAILQNAKAYGFRNFDQETEDRYHELFYGAGKSDVYAVSGSIFKLGDFSQAPLTPAEIRAIPYLFGYWPEVFEYVTHSDEEHRAPLIEKFQVAGYAYEAEFLSAGLKV